MTRVIEDDVPVALDAIDKRILALLQQDAALTNQALASRVSVSPATCLRRVRRLQQTGVIQRTVALLNSERLGPGLLAISEVTLDRQGAEHLEAFEQRAVGHPAVRQCYRVSPGPDFVLLAAARDMSQWAQVTLELFTQDANVRNVKTYFSVRRAKFETAHPIPAGPR